MNKLGLQRMVANMDYQNSQLALQRTRIEVSSQVKSDYYSVLVAEQNVIISAALVRFTERVLTLQTEMLSSGKTVPYEPAQLRTLVEAARATLVAAQNSYVASWKKLAATVGVPDLPPSQLAGEANAPPPKINYQDALERMWSVHPDVLAGRNMIAQARYQLRLDRVKPIPDVYIYGTFQKDFTTPGFQNVSYNTQLGVPLPIFDRNRGAIINAEGDLMRADQQVRRMQLDLQRQLAQVFGDYETNRSNVQRYREKILPDATRAYRGVYGRYIQKAGEVLTVTDIAFAQQQLATFIATYINYLNGQWQSVADLANLLQIDNFNDLYDIRNAPVEPLPNRTPPKQKGGH
jgi:cobalt-zinc-cadmium efflux system outer membrane protein